MVQDQAFVPSCPYQFHRLFCNVLYDFEWLQVVIITVGDLCTIQRPLGISSQLDMI